MLHLYGEAEMHIEDTDGRNPIRENRESEERKAAVFRSDMCCTAQNERPCRILTRSSRRGVSALLKKIKKNVRRSRVIRELNQFSGISIYFEIHLVNWKPLE